MYLGLDLGTSGLRAILMDSAGTVVASSDQAYPVAHPHAGWSEQDPADWITGCSGAIADLRANAPDQFAAVQGIGLSGQMHGAVLLDAADQVLRPAILWNDTRSADQARRLDAAADVRELSGNIVFPGFTAPKLMWCAANEPDIFGRVAKVLLPKDYLRLWLTGEHVSEMSDAAGTSWLDVGRRQWSDRLLERSGMRPDQMPRLVEGSAPSGVLRRTLCQEWRLSGTVTVAGGGGDNAAAACGTGCVEEGGGFVSLGTSGVMLVARDCYAPAPDTAVHTFCHALPGRWLQMGVILAATDCLNWLARNLGQSPADLAGLADRMADDLTPPGDLMFLPYLSGERTPHNDAHIRAAFVGLDVAHGPADLVQALMRGVAFALRDSLAALRATGAAPSQLLAIGGGAQSRYWLRILATVLDLPLMRPAAGELGAALGAARLAQVAATGSAPRVVMTPPQAGDVILPDPALTAAYEDAWHRYRALYKALKPREKP